MTIIDLEQPRFSGMPIFPDHQPGYSYFLHRRHRDTLKSQPGSLGRSSSSGVLVMMEHSGTHVDAICHQAEDLKFYGCHDADDYESVNGFSMGDATAIPVFHHPGVLIDLVRDNDGAEVSASALISLEQVQRAAKKQNAVPAPGEVALIRTGNGRYWNDSERYLNGPGMSPDVSQWLADLGVVAVGADNMAWDLQGYVDPKVNCDLPGHVILLVRSGIHIFENVNLERLGDAGVGRFTFFAAPLQLRGATGSPIRPIAVLEGGDQ